MDRPCLTCGTLSDGSYCPDHRRGGSTRQWRKLREQVLARDEYRCHCGQLATEVDHIIPVRDGGTDVPSNLRATCTACNPRGPA